MARDCLQEERQKLKYRDRSGEDCSPGRLGAVVPKRRDEQGERTYAALPNTGLWRPGLPVWWHIKSLFLEEQHC